MIWVRLSPLSGGILQHMHDKLLFWKWSKLLSSFLALLINKGTSWWQQATGFHSVLVVDANLNGNTIFWKDLFHALVWLSVLDNLYWSLMMERFWFNSRQTFNITAQICWLCLYYQFLSCKTRIIILRNLVRCTFQLGITWNKYKLQTECTSGYCKNWNIGEEM